MTKFISQEKILERRMPDGPPPVREFADGVRLQDHINVQKNDKQVVAEFIGNDNFSQDFITRQEYEVDAGRQMVPELYQEVYDVQRNSNFPKIVEIDVMGPGGFVFEEILPGGEVKFASMESSDKSVKMRHWGQGIEYDEDIFIYNQTWRLSPIERMVGKAHNALMNHLHFNPILTATLTGDNATAAVTSGSTLVENFLLTIEAAITDSKKDKTNPRPGPYVLLVASDDFFKTEKALMEVPQQGISRQSRSAIGKVRSVVEYDGWSGTRGKKAVTYPGVTAGEAFLVSQAWREFDFQSKIKQDLRRIEGDKNMNRFIIGVDIFDVRLGIFSDPKRSVQKITWPTS